MSLFRKLFPAENRSYPGKRWVETALRTLHLIGTAGIGGWQTCAISHRCSCGASNTCNPRIGIVNRW